MKTKLQKLIEDFFNLANLDLTDLEIEMEKPDEYYLNIETDDAKLFTFRNGEGVRSLQHIVNLMCRNQEIIEPAGKMKIDIGGYRRKQEQGVVNIAEERIKTLKESSASQSLPPMSPYFRRIVHVHIAENHPDVITESSGEEDNRYIKISLK